MNPRGNMIKASAGSTGGTEPLALDDGLAVEDDNDVPDAEGWRTGSDDNHSMAGSSEAEEDEEEEEDVDGDVEEDDIFSTTARSPSGEPS